MAPNDLFTIGVIVAPHGVRGDVRIMPETDDPRRFLELETCYIDGILHHVTAARLHKQFVLLTFAEVGDRDGAERLVRKTITVTRADLQPLPEGRHYIFDLVGLRVVDTQGQELGYIREVLQPGANDVYVVDTPSGTDVLLPVIHSVVLDIDVEGGRVVVDPPEWI